MNLTLKSNSKSNPYVDVPKIKLFQRMSYFGARGVSGCGTQIQLDCPSITQWDAVVTFAAEVRF